MATHIVRELLARRLEGVEQAGAAMDGVHDALVIKRVGVEHLQLLAPAIAPLLERLQAPFT